MSDLLKRAQAAGWLVLRNDAQGAIGACPREGCGVTVRLMPDRPVPSACAPQTGLNDVLVGSNEDARVALRARRQQLGLSLHDVDEITGLTVDHVAKAEKPNPSKAMGMDLLPIWAAALGYEVVLRPRALPPLALRILAAKSRP